MDNSLFAMMSQMTKAQTEQKLVETQIKCFEELNQANILTSKINSLKALFGDFNARELMENPETLNKMLEFVDKLK